MRWRSLLLFGLLGGCVTPGPNWQDPPVLDDVAEQYVDIDGAWLRVRDMGPRDMGHLPIVLVHGYGSRLEAWKELQPRLAKTRRVVSFDQRGFGQSSRAKGAYGPVQHAKDVLALMDALDIEHAVLIGHSYGGGVVLRAALQAEDRVRGVGLVSAFALEEDVPTDFRWAQVPGVGEMLFGAFYKEVPGEKYLLAFDDREQFVSLEAIDEMEAMMDIDGATYTALATVRGMKYADVEDRYRDLSIPVTLVWGENDRVVPLDQGKRLAAKIDAPLVVLPACGHMPSWERPKSLWRALAPMVKEAEQTRRQGASPPPASRIEPAENEANVAPDEERDDAVDRAAEDDAAPEQVDDKDPDPPAKASEPLPVGDDEPPEGVRR